MSPFTIYLISGASRGIGFALVAHILETNDSAFVYAGVRNPSITSALKDLQVKYSDRVAIVNCISGDYEGNKGLAKEIEERHGHVDTVIANAGICLNMTPVADVTLSELEQHFHVNTFGPIILFQSVYSLLKKSSTPRFIPISSPAGCLSDANVLIRSTLGAVSYGASKAALNWATRKLHFENDWLIAFPLSPGAVDTDMLTNNIENDSSGFIKGFIPATGAPTASQVATMLMKIIDESTRERDGGEFLNVDGSKLPW